MKKIVTYFFLFFIWVILILIFYNLLVLFFNKKWFGCMTKSMAYFLLWFVFAVIFMIWFSMDDSFSCLTVLQRTGIIASLTFCFRFCPIIIHESVWTTLNLTLNSVLHSYLPLPYFHFLYKNSPNYIFSLPIDNVLDIYPIPTLSSFVKPCTNI